MACLDSSVPQVVGIQHAGYVSDGQALVGPLDHWAVR